MNVQDIQVWIVPIPAHLDQFNLSGVLSPDELKKSAEMSHTGRRREFLFSRYILRNLLHSYLQVPPQEFKFQKNKFGKIHLTDQDIKFNLSHSSHHVALIFSESSEVGIDIESLERRVHFEELAKIVFSKEEGLQIQNLPADRRQKRFLEIWTLKEAYLKAIGLGITDTLNELSFKIQEPIFLSQKNDVVSGWYFHTLSTPKLQLSLAVHPCPSTKTNDFLTPSEMESKNLAGLTFDFFRLAKQK